MKTKIVSATKENQRTTKKCSFQHSTKWPETPPSPSSHSFVSTRALWVTSPSHCTNPNSRQGSHSQQQRLSLAVWWYYYSSSVPGTTLRRKHQTNVLTNHLRFSQSEKTVIISHSQEKNSSNTSCSPFAVKSNDPSPRPLVALLRLRRLPPRTSSCR